jgi:ABC-type branched-subunit amino acid transport system ATPase component
VSSVLSCKGVHGGYDETAVLFDVSLELASGDIYALMGKNGAGKTSFFLTVLGVLAPSAGSIRLFDHDTTGWAPHKVAVSGVGCAPQENAFFQDLTVNENLRLGSLTLDRRAFQRGRDRVISMFPFIGDRLQQRAGTLSGGEQAMVKVARALLPEPRFLLLDEVTEGLQPLTVERVRDVLVRDHNERGATLLIIEQNIQFVAGFANRFGLMERGRLTGEGRFDGAAAIARITRHLSV